MGNKVFTGKGSKNAGNDIPESDCRFKVGDLVELRRGCKFLEIILEESLNNVMCELGLDPDGPLRVAWVDWQGGEVAIEAGEEDGLVIVSMLLRAHWYH